MADIRIDISSRTLGDITVNQNVPFSHVDARGERQEVFGALAAAVERIAGAYGIGMRLTGENITAARIDPTSI